MQQEAELYDLRPQILYITPAPPENYRWGHFQSTDIDGNHSMGDRSILVLAKMLTRSNSMRSSHCCMVNLVSARMAPLKMVDYYLQNISYIKYTVGKDILGVAFTCTHEKPWCTCFSTIMRFHWSMFRGNLPVSSCFKLFQAVLMWELRPTKTGFTAVALPGNTLYVPVFTWVLTVWSLVSIWFSEHMHRRTK